MVVFKYDYAFYMGFLGILEPTQWLYLNKLADMRVEIGKNLEPTQWLYLNY